MKKHSIIILLLLSFVLSNCENSNSELNTNNDDISVLTDTILIKTNKIIYTSNEFIEISITNYLDNIVTGYLCDNHYLPPQNILKQEITGWNEQVYAVWCSFMGPTGYYADLMPEETVIYNHAFIDPYLFNNESEGLYKFKYQFIFESDTAFYYSNEFRIID